MFLFSFFFSDVESPSPEPDGDFKSTPLPLDLVFTTNPTLFPGNGTIPINPLHGEDSDFGDFGTSRQVY